MYSLILAKVHLFAVNIVIDIIFIDLRRGKSYIDHDRTSFTSPKNTNCANLFSSIVIDRDRINLVTTENAPNEIMLNSSFMPPSLGLCDTLHFDKMPELYSPKEPANVIRSKI